MACFAAFFYGNLLAENLFFFLRVLLMMFITYRNYLASNGVREHTRTVYWNTSVCTQNEL
jgi:hypothetical protein